MRYEHDSTYLVHYGILGQKWGVRRFQNEDGTLTAAGKERYYDSNEYTIDSNGIKYADVTNKEQLDYLYNQSALSIEGVHARTDSDRAMLKRVFEERYGIDTKEMALHTIDGKTMNKFYKLTGDNAYQDNLHILSITGLPTGKQLDNLKTDLGMRWFDDIVDNNRLRENA